MAGVGEVASIIAAIQAADRILCLCGKYASAFKDAKKDIERLKGEVKALRKILKIAEEVPDSSPTRPNDSETVSPGLADSIEQCISTLGELESQLDFANERKTVRLCPQALKWAFKRKEVEKIVKALIGLKMNIVLALNVDQCHGRQIDKLQCAYDAAFNSHQWEHMPRCLHNTRVKPLGLVHIWSGNPHSPCIFWLRGMAGTGKSTIARTVAHEFAEQKILGASFFFSRGRGDLGRAEKFFSTIAAQLASKEPLLRAFIGQAISKNPQIVRGGLGEQWKHLILQPLMRLQEELIQQDNRSVEPQVFFLVIDALDECDSEDDIRLILRRLAESKELRKVRLRIFITSRPEKPIRSSFNKMPGDAHRDFALHEIDKATTQKDISTFLEHNLEDIRKDFCIGQGWPSKDSIRCLAESANGLFIYAETACRFLRDSKISTPEAQLELLIQGGSDSQSPYGAVDKIYLQVLAKVLIGDCDSQVRNKITKRFQAVVGPIVTSFDALSCTSLANLTNDVESRVRTLLDNLHSLLDIPTSLNNPIQLLHPSFRDFVLDPDRCSTDFWIDERKTHEHLAKMCLSFMTNHLKRDICGLKNLDASRSTAPPNRVEQCLPAELQYACRYWIQHLQKSGVHPEDDGPVPMFLEKHFLHWLEALSFMRKSFEAILAITSLESILRAEQCPKPHSFVHDAKRFALYNQSIIEQAPLQLYCSALLFAPETSVVRTKFKDQIPRWIRWLPKVQRNWSSLEQTLEGHTDWVTNITFSPDGGKVASGSDDLTVRVWDLATGQVDQTLEGHKNSVTSVAFSPNGGKVVSGSRDEMVRVWDIVTGQVERICEGHSDWVTSVAFSPDGGKVASGSSDQTVLVWDITTGQVDQTLKGHFDAVTSVTFSPDGAKVASGSDDLTIRVWDLATGQVNQALQGHLNLITSIAFSPDGGKMASGSDDLTVRVWDLATAQVDQTLEGHFDSVTSIAFSPDSDKILSGSSDRTVRVWNIATGQVDQTLEGHSDSVTSVAFLPDGSKVASGSEDQTLRVWSIATSQVDQTLDGHSDSVRGVAFSPDGSKVVSGSSDRTVQVWDVATGQVDQILEGHSDSVISVTFSPDGRKVASGSSDLTVRVWDIATGRIDQTLEGHSNWVISVTFSPSGDKVASGSSDRTIRVWDIATGQVNQTLGGYSNSMINVTFSPDSGKVASWSDDLIKMRVWDISTGQVDRTLEDHSDWVTSVAFSSDGSKPYPLYSVSESGFWVRQNRLSVLYLPFDFREGVVASKEDSIAIGTRTGRVVIITFDSDFNAETI